MNSLQYSHCKQMTCDGKCPQALETCEKCFLFAECQPLMEGLWFEEHTYEDRCKYRQNRAVVMLRIADFERMLNES